MLFFLNSLGYVLLLKALATPRKKQNKPQVILKFIVLLVKSEASKT